MAKDNLGHHVHDDKDSEEEISEEEIKDLFKTAEESSAFGPREIREQQVKTPKGNQTLHSVTSSFQVSESDEWEKRDTEAVHSCICGCATASFENIRVCGVCGQLVCIDHTVYCVECCQPVWIYYAEMKGNDAYCISCLKKTRLKRAFIHFRRLLLTILWGLAGRDYVQEHPSLSNKPLGHTDGTQLSVSPKPRSNREPEDSYQHRNSGQIIQRS